MNKTTVNQSSAIVMRKKRLHHDKVVEKYKSREYCEENVSLFQQNMYSVQKDAFKNDEEDYDDENNDHSVMFNDQELVIKVVNNEDDSETSQKVQKRKKNQEIIDKEHFIPYKPKNYSQEKA